ncbi:MAG: hypothetical protein EXR36_07360 [Betaproteobacteria bacterium]|nr:hypothetical protein [Betaproteobacteria bacterium]
MDAAFCALVLGFGPDYLDITSDIFRHGREIMTRASAHDRYQGLPAQAILEAEIHYVGFERRILERRHEPLRGTCLGMALDDHSLAASLRETLAKSGAVIVNLLEDSSPERIVSQWGGLDALVVEPSQRACVEPLMPLLECAPFGGKLLCLSARPLPSTANIRSIAVGPDEIRILKMLMRE